MYFNWSNTLSLSINVIFMSTLPSFYTSYLSNFMPCSLSIHCCFVFFVLAKCQGHSYLTVCLAWVVSLHLYIVGFILSLKSLCKYSLDKIYNHFGWNTISISSPLMYHLILSSLEHVWLPANSTFNLFTIHYLQWKVNEKSNFPCSCSPAVM